jgi:hypothetical protein
MRIAGVHVSSYWPDLTAQMKPARKSTATPRLARIRMTMTAMRSVWTSNTGIPDPTEAGNRIDFDPAQDRHPGADGSLVTSIPAS